MAAQEADKKFEVCDRCFATIPAGKTFCPECGAPVSAGQTADGSDQAVYAELSRANLLRMRGEYKQAEEQCINILKRYPNNTSANTLLGDIAAEKGEYDQAIQWYELALDLTPDSAALKGKLQGVRERRSQKEAAETAKHLGIPTERKSARMYTIGVCVLLLVVLVLGYYIGAKQKADNTGPSKLITSDPVQVGNGKTPNDNTNDSNSNLRDAGDAALLQRFNIASTDGDKVIAIFEDPLNLKLTIALRTPGAGEDSRAFAARIAKTALQTFSGAPSCNVREMSNGKLTYSADIERNRLDDALSPTWAESHKDQPDAWIDYVLSREWPPSSKPSKTVPAGGTDNSTVDPSAQGTTTGGDAGTGDASKGGTTSSQPNSGSSTTGTTTGSSTGSGAPTSTSTGGAAGGPTSTTGL